MENFSTAGPRVSGELGMELLMQARPNGRILDHYRVTLGGSRILDVTFPIAKLTNIPAAATWQARHQVWPRDIEIRRNMTTSAWVDLATLVSANNTVVTDERDEPVQPERFVETFRVIQAGAAIRFAVVVADDNNMQLQLQGMPAAPATLMSKPQYRG
jgi:hypothetical protein